MKARLSYGAVAALMRGDLAKLLNSGAIEVYSGDPPTYADNAVRGELLGRITTDGLPWASGQASNGLSYVVDGAYIRKNPNHRWVLKGTAAGQASWFRVLSNTFDNGLDSVSLARLDGDIAAATEGYDAHMLMPDINISPGKTVEINEFWLSLDY